MMETSAHSEQGSTTDWRGGRAGGETAEQRAA